MLTIDLDALGLQDGTRVLDLGCGQGRHIHNIYHRAPVHVIGVDLSLEDAIATRNGLTYFPPPKPSPQGLEHIAHIAVADATRLPFADAAFDTIICSEVLEHIMEYKQALQEITRIVKPGGVVALSVPRAWPEWLCWRLSKDYAKTPGGHVRIFNAQALKSDVEACGLEFIGRHWAHALHVPYWWLKCLFWSRRDTLWLIRLYRKILVWDLSKRPWITRGLETMLNPLMGKSVVLYFQKGLAP